jgi:hypothetical protein
VIALLSVAWAEPLAARVPADGVVVVGGLPEVGAAVWFGEHLGVSAGYDVRGYTGDVAAIGRWTLTRGASGFGVDVGAGAGVVLPFAGLRPAFELAPWIGAGWRRPSWHVVLDVAVPAAIAFGEGSLLRVPVVVEPWAGFTVAEWTFSAGAGIGQVYVPGELPAFALRWQVGVGYRFGG